MLCLLEMAVFMGIHWYPHIVFPFRCWVIRSMGAGYSRPATEKRRRCFDLSEAKFAFSSYVCGATLVIAIRSPISHYSSTEKSRASLPSHSGTLPFLFPILVTLMLVHRFIG
ncbi:hypothetical protein FRB91_006915 [Serendipita sp. 411]|nr:hypothetical protein FRB91_006915 [Serendipita sp. 411]